MKITWEFEGHEVWSIVKNLGHAFGESLGEVARKEVGKHRRPRR